MSGMRTWCSSVDGGRLAVAARAVCSVGVVRWQKGLRGERLGDRDSLREDGVDVHGDRRQRHARRPVGEALWMRAVCGVERGLAYSGDLGDAAVEDIGWCEQGEARVVMLVVVPGEEVLE